MLAGANNEPLCLLLQGYVDLDFESVADTDVVTEAMVLRGVPGPGPGPLPAVTSSRWNMKGLHALGECLALGRQLNELNLLLSHAHPTSTVRLGLCPTSTEPIRTPFPVPVHVFLTTLNPAAGTNFVG